MIDDLNHMDKILGDIETKIKHHKEPHINVSEIEPRYIEESFIDIEYCVKKLRSIITELRKY